MNYTFSIHGVPYGSQVWGGISDNEYLKSFYNSVSASNVPAQMIVDIRYLNNKVCSYYHYLVLNNILDNQSRTGSYFGMTICFEGVYCSDFKNLYQLFDACFNQVVVGKLLVQTGEHLRYTIDDFNASSNNDLLMSVADGIRNNMNMFEEHMRNLPANYTPKHRNDNIIEKWSLRDIGNQTFIDVLMRDAMASVSPHYPVSQIKIDMLQDENKAKSDKINTLEAQVATLTGRNNSLQAAVAAKGQEINQQNSTIGQQKTTINTLNSDKCVLQTNLEAARQEIDKLKKDLDYLRSNMDNKILHNCFEQLKAVAERRNEADKLLKELEPKVNRTEETVNKMYEQFNPKKRLKKVYVLATVLLLLVLVALVIFFRPSSDSSASFDNGKEQVKTTSQPKTQDVTPEPKSESQSEPESEPEPEVTYDGDKIKRVDIKELLDGLHVPSNTDLHLTAHGCKTGGGKFRIKYEGCDKWDEIESDGLKAKVKIDDSHIGEEVKFDYLFNGESYKERTLIVKERDSNS